MKQEGYVNAEGAPIVHKEIDKKTLMIRIGIVALVVFIIIFIFIIVCNFYYLGFFYFFFSFWKTSFGVLSFLICIV